MKTKELMYNLKAFPTILFTLLIFFSNSVWAEVYELPPGACISDLWPRRDVSRDDYSDFVSDATNHFSNSYHWGKEKAYSACVVNYIKLFSNGEKDPDYLKEKQNYPGEAVSRFWISSIIGAPLGYAAAYSGSTWFTSPINDIGTHWACYQHFRALKKLLCKKSIHGIDGVIHENEDIIEL